MPNERPVLLSPIADYRSLADLAYEAIRNEILAGRLPGGTRLIEAQLARDLRMSRGPVREALRRLAEHGLADLQPRRGVVVRTLALADIQAIADFRIGVETMAARLAVRQRADTTRLRELVDEFTRAANQVNERRVVELELEFHREICRLSANPYILGAFQTIETQIRNFVDLNTAVYADLTGLTPMHQELVAALEQDDEEVADRVVRDHITGGTEPLLPKAQEQAEQSPN